MFFYKRKVIDKLKKAIIIVLGFFILASSISCIDVDLVDKPNTKVNIKLPSSNIDLSSSYTLEINDQKLIIGSEGNFPELFPGVYPLLVYSNAPSVNVVNGIAQVNTINGQMNNFPDLFFSKSTEIRLEGNSVSTTSIVLDQQIKLLEMRITPPSGSAYDHISTIEGKITGVASQWDLIKNIVVGPAMEVPVRFVKQSDGAWLAQVRLLGVFGAKQELIGEIRFLDRSNQPRLLASNLRANQDGQILNIQSDLSDSFKDFNTNKNIPLTLNGEIELPKESSFVVSINDWQRESESGVAW